MATQQTELYGRVEHALSAGADYLRRQQKPDVGCFDLGFDGAALPDAHFIFVDFVLALGRHEVRAALVRRLLDRQLAEGGWAPAPGLAADPALTVEAYVALRAAGLGPRERALQRARQLIGRHQGEGMVRGPTQFTLALLGLQPWPATTIPPPELALLPPEAPVSLFRVSVPMRLHLAPLLVLRAMEVVVAPELGRSVGAELGLPWTETNPPLRPQRAIRDEALSACVDFMVQRLDEDGSLGGLLLATGWAALAAQAMGLAAEHPLVTELPRGLASLVYDAHDRGIHVQVCRPTVRTTALALRALRRAGLDGEPVDQAGTYLLEQQAGPEGDFARLGPDGPARGWSIKPRSRRYPSLLDTIEVVDALAGPEGADLMAQALRWVASMQRPDGGFALFDRAAASAPWLRHLALGLLIHTLRDESSPEVTGRLLQCAAAMPFLEARQLDRAVDFLARSQRAGGAWTSSFSVGCLPSTGAALAGLAAVGQGFAGPARQALAFLVERQRPDGGWGESPRSTADQYVDLGRSLPSLTGRVLVGLQALRDPAAQAAVEQGLWYLVRTQEPEGSWHEEDTTAASLSEVLYVRNPVDGLAYPLLALHAFLEQYRATPVG